MTDAPVSVAREAPESSVATTTVSACPMKSLEVTETIFTKWFTSTVAQNVRARKDG